MTEPTLSRLLAGIDDAPDQDEAWDPAISRMDEPRGRRKKARKARRRG